MKLIVIPQDGILADGIAVNEHLGLVIKMTIPFYEKVGFNPPWTSYVALKNSEPVGTCAFKSSPVDGRVEIAYFTFPGFEGQGVATAMARELVQIAQREVDSLIVFAQTLPEENASTTVLKKLGFRMLGPVEHSEDGTVWEWELSA